MPAKTENLINSVTSSVDTGTSIKFIGESDSTGNNLRIEDGKLSGTIVGSVIKDYTGRVDDVTLELANVPIDGVGGGAGGGSNVEIVNITLGATDPDGYFVVDSCDKTFSELEAAVLAGKMVFACVVASRKTSYVPLEYYPKGGEFDGTYPNFLISTDEGGNVTSATIDVLNIMWETISDTPQVTTNEINLPLNPDK